ncbi:hypothetical protein NDU88_000327, partial [Pleurodeles waltl]
VKDFCYLGLYLSSTLSWKFHLNFKLQQLIRNVEAIFRFARRLGHRPVHQILTLYNSKCVSAAIYGGGL